MSDQINSKYVGVQGGPVPLEVSLVARRLVRCCVRQFHCTPEPNAHRLDGILRFSVPLSCLWIVLLIAGLIRYDRKGLWLLLGLLLAIYWPYSLRHGVPSCHWIGNCF